MYFWNVCCWDSDRLHKEKMPHQHYYLNQKDCFQSPVAMLCLGSGMDEKYTSKQPLFELAGFRNINSNIFPFKKYYGYQTVVNFILV